MPAYSSRLLFGRSRYRCTCQNHKYSVRSVHGLFPLVRRNPNQLPALSAPFAAAAMVGAPESLLIRLRPDEALMIGINALLIL